MPRRTLSIEERNALERYAIERGKARGLDQKRGSMLFGFVEGFMESVQLTPALRKAALAGVAKPVRKAKVRQLSLVDGKEATGKPHAD